MEKLINNLIKDALGIDKVEIETHEDSGETIYTIKTDPENIGLIIGKGGKTIKSFRRLVKTRAILENKRVNLFVST